MRFIQKIVLIFMLFSIYGQANNDTSKPIKAGKTIQNILFKLDSSTSPNIETGLIKEGYKNLKEPALNLGFYKGGVWLKFPIPKRNIDLLVIEHPILDYAAAYTKVGEQLNKVDEFGDQIPFSTRTNKTRFPILDLNEIQAKTDTIYLFASNQGEQFFLPIVAWNEKDLELFNQYDYPLFGGYFGIIFFAIFFNLFIAIVLKEKNILNYVFYLISLFILQVSLNGFGTLWFWGDNVWLATHANTIFASASIFFLITFTLEFLSIKEYLPKIYKFINVAKYLVGLNIIASIILPVEILSLPIVFINVITFLFGIIIIPVAYSIYKNHFKEARYFLLAFVILIIGVFAFVLRNIGLLPNNFFAINGLQIGSSMEVILLTFAIIDKFKSFREQALERLQQINIMKEKANKELEQKVQERTHDLEKSYIALREQKEIIEEKNIEITESINYGEKIQSAILPSQEEIEQNTAESFVIFKPKDIVSGDFYWISHTDDFSFYIVADCTGHGVPGAFMSMIGNSLLDQIINKDHETSTGTILDKLREGVIRALGQKGNPGEQKDGMDIALIRVNHETNELVFSGANNPLYVVSKNELQNGNLEAEKNNSILYTFKANKQPIGFQSEADQTFSETSIQLSKGDQIYLFTDGYPDQFGGPKGKKMKYKKFKELILENSTSPLDIQKIKLEAFLNDWMTQENTFGEKIFQVDDICIMGLKL